VARFSELDQADSATHVEIFVKCRDKLRGGWSRFEDMMTSMQGIVRHTSINEGRGLVLETLDKAAWRAAPVAYCRSEIRSCN
jgi:hypothetical protein